MARSWKEAREIAEQKGLDHVYHDFDAKEYGACSQSERFGHFKGGLFMEHRCICMPARFTAEELEEKERKFIVENPEWACEE